MKLELVFPNVNRNKSYTSNLRRFTVFVNSKQRFVIDQDSVLNGEIEVNEGDKIYIEKRFAYKNKDSHFYYIVGQNRAELVKGTLDYAKKKYVAVDISDGVLHVLDDNDFRKAVHVGK